MPSRRATVAVAALAGALSAGTAAALRPPAWTAEVGVTLGTLPAPTPQKPDRSVWIEPAREVIAALRSGGTNRVSWTGPESVLVTSRGESAEEATRHLDDALAPLEESHRRAVAEWKRITRGASPLAKPTARRAPIATRQDPPIGLKSSLFGALAGVVVALALAAVRSPRAVQSPRSAAHDDVTPASTQSSTSVGV